MMQVFWMQRDSLKENCQKGLTKGLTMDWMAIDGQQSSDWRPSPPNAVEVSMANTQTARALSPVVTR